MVVGTCENTTLLPILIIVKRSILLIQIMVPILLIIMGSVYFFKMIKSPDDKKGLKKVFTMFIAAFVVFVIPVIVDAVISMVGEDSNFSNCWKNADDHLTITKEIVKEDNKNRKSLIQDPKEYEKGVPKPKNNAANIGSSSVTCLAKNKKNKVLFYGNSKTVGPDGGEVIRDNNVAVKFEGIAKSKGYDVEVTTIDEGLGSQHGRLNGAYDCYVDQQCTDCMSNPEGVASAISSRANTLKNSNPNVKIYLRQIWTYCSGGKINDDGGLKTAFDGAAKAASIANVNLIPDGKAMLNNKNAGTGINVCDDDRHQNNKGAYLIGATVFKFLSGESPVGATFYADIDAGTAKKLLEIAK